MSNGGVQLVVSMVVSCQQPWRWVMGSVWSRLELCMRACVRARVRLQFKTSWVGYHYVGCWVNTAFIGSSPRTSGV